MNTDAAAASAAAGAASAAAIVATTTARSRPPRLSPRASSKPTKMGANGSVEAGGVDSDMLELIFMKAAKSRSFPEMSEISAESTCCWAMSAVSGRYWST